MDQNLTQTRDWVQEIWENDAARGEEQRWAPVHHLYAEPKIQWISDNHCPKIQQAIEPLPLPCLVTKAYLSKMNSYMVVWPEFEKKNWAFTYKLQFVISMRI